MSKNVLILGAGPAGLSAAWELSKEGARVEILEMEPRVGGLCSSIEKDGFIFDLGGHRFITKDSLVLTEMEELMGDEFLVRPRKSVIRIRGKFFAYPLEIQDILRKMNPIVSFKSSMDFFLTKLYTHSRMPDSSFENWVIKRFGKTMYDIYFGPYSRKLWGLAPNQISADWAAQRISLINLTDVLLRALGKKKDMPKTYAKKFLYPKKGIGQISDRMLEEIKNNNGQIHLNAKVGKIIVKNNRIEKVIYSQDGKEKSMSSDFVVSTIPLPEFILDIEPKVDDQYIQCAKQMSFRSIKFLHIFLDTGQVSDNTWIYIPEEKYFFFRIQERANWSPTVVPEGKNALTLEIACNKDDQTWNASDEEIYQRSIKDLEDLGLITKKQVKGFFTQKIEHAYPIYSLDYKDKIKTAYQLLSGIRDFISIGRQGLYRYNNMDHSLKMGILTAKHVLHKFPRQKIFDIATENIIFDWHDPGFHNGATIKRID